MDRPGLASSIVVLAAELVAGFVQGAETAPSADCVILIPAGAPAGTLTGEYYEMAIYRMPGEPEISRAAMLASLCVSHTLVGQFRHAQHHCDKALEETRSAAGEASGGKRTVATELALAHSNRGVLRARSADPVGAEADFRTALELQPETGIPARNLARLLESQPPP